MDISLKVTTNQTPGDFQMWSSFQGSAQILSNTTDNAKIWSHMQKALPKVQFPSIP